jgi:thiol:disulfide interchange protein
MISKKPFPLSKYMAIVWPFQTEVWIFVLLALLLMGPTYWIFLRIGPQIMVSSIDDAVLDVVKCIIMQSECICFKLQGGGFNNNGFSEKIIKKIRLLSDFGCF